MTKPDPIAKAIEALEYYADPTHYEDFITLGGNRGPPVLRMGEKLAADALAGLRDLQKAGQERDA